MGNAAAIPAGHGTRDVVASTAPIPGQNAGLRAMPLTGKVRVSVFVGRDRGRIAHAADQQ